MRAAQDGAPHNPATAAATSDVDGTSGTANTAPEGTRDERDKVLDTLLGPGAQVRP